MFYNFLQFCKNQFVTKTIKCPVQIREISQTVNVLTIKKLKFSKIGKKLFFSNSKNWKKKFLSSFLKLQLCEMIVYKVHKKVFF